MSGDEQEPAAEGAAERCRLWDGRETRARRTAADLGEPSPFLVRSPPAPADPARFVRHCPWIAAAALSSFIFSRSSSSACA